MPVSKYCNSVKSLTIENGHLSAYLKARKQIYYQSKYIVLNRDLGVFETHYNSVDWIDYYFDHVKDIYFDCASRLVESRKKRCKRASQKIEKLLQSGHAIFITLTFTNEVLESTSPETRRRYVARFLKDSCEGGYVANIDYSDKQREHYHGVIDNRIDLKKWCYGFSFAEQVRLHDGCAKRLSYYVNKLTSHAFKTTKQVRLIYSRNCSIL